MFKLKIMNGYVIGAVLGLLVGAILYYVQPVTWQGNALIKVGQYNKNNFIEAHADVIERIYSRAFIKSVAERSQREDIISLLSPQDDARMSVKQTKGGESLLISVSGGSADIVQTSLDSIVMELLSRHEALMTNYLEYFRNEESRLHLEKDVLSKRLSIIFNSQEHARHKPAEERRLVTGFEVMTIQHDLEYKMNRSSELRDTISSANIRPTTLMENLSIFERRFFSKLWRACLFGALAGIFISAIWIRWGK
jgi:hypothetical protein